MINQLNSKNMKNNPSVSFIMSNYNNEGVLNLFFEKFEENNTYKNYEFIVVDDGSEDNGLELLKQWQASGKINNMKVVAEPHKGIINALNKALRMARGEFIIRCDDDATIESKSPVEKFLEFYSVFPEKIGVITSKIITDIENVPLHAIGRNVVSPEGLYNRGMFPDETIGKRTWDSYSSPVGNLKDILDEPAECDTALGVFTFCDRRTALKIGGFDENYPLYIEDDDFYLSFRKYGKKVFYLPDVEVCHRWSLRGSRLPDSCKTKRLGRLFFWERKENGIKCKILNLPLFRIKNTYLKQKYYLLGMKIWVKRWLDWRQKILLHDYEYWNQKWGFDPLNPDLDYIKKKYAGTEILWKYIKIIVDDNFYMANESILSKIKDLFFRKKLCISF